MAHHQSGRLACAQRFDVWTPNHQIHELIKLAVTEFSGPGMSHALCARMAASTGVLEAALTGLAQMISRNLRLKPSDSPSLLARQFLTGVFAGRRALGHDGPRRDVRLRWLDVAGPAAAGA